jgi:hypothetical protein
VGLCAKVDSSWGEKVITPKSYNFVLHKFCFSMYIYVLDQKHEIILS